MREWCRKNDFQDILPDLLEGEDDEFSAYILAVAKSEELSAAQA
jgi:hypothetical protein